jgi:hypothetical protein
MQQAPSGIIRYGKGRLHVKCGRVRETHRGRSVSREGENRVKGMVRNEKKRFRESSGL